MLCGAVNGEINYIVQSAYKGSVQRGHRGLRNGPGTLLLFPFQGFYQSLLQFTHVFAACLMDARKLSSMTRQELKSTPATQMAWLAAG